MGVFTKKTCRSYGALYLGLLVLQTFRSYGALLLCFFVLIILISQISITKKTSLGESFSKIQILHYATAEAVLQPTELYIWAYSYYKHFAPTELRLRF